jgi:uncharacterized membrane protein YfcA
MAFFIIILASFTVSLLTFFSGFGLGTLLMPVMAVFFPVDIAIALTGVVHFSNNLFKIFLVGKKADKNVLIRFGIPAIVAAFLGAWLLIRLNELPPLYEYSVGSRLFLITPVKAVIAVILIIFAMLEIIPAFRKLEFNRNKLPWGGLLSGFFGGLSGMQGAIRSAFLVRTGLSKEAYIATAVILSCFIDITRLSVYATRFNNANLLDNLPLVISATIAAIAGAFIGNKLLKKITLGFIQKLVAVMLVILSLALGLGLI